MKIYPYQVGSESAKALANALGVKRLRKDGPHVDCTVLNWGATRIYRQCEGAIINHPDNVKKASNKLETFKTLSGDVSMPEWTEELLEASKWLAEGFDVVSRLKLNGHSGEGLVINEALKDAEVVAAPLYTKYVKKKEEYRVHVCEGEAFFIQRKARKHGVPDDEVNWKVRNHANGFIFAHQNVDVPDIAKQMCQMAIDGLGLQFGACDIMLGVDKKWYLLEVNTACGLEGTTLERYTEAFQRYIE